MRGRFVWPLVLLLGVGSFAAEGEAGSPRSRRSARREQQAALRQALERELALTEDAIELERGHKALERERESLSWAAELLDRRGRESLRQHDVYRDERVERQKLAEVRAHKLYKLARGGMLEHVFETGDGARSSPRERLLRGQTLRFLIEHDLERLRVHAQAEAHARAELLGATRELSALAALETVAQLQGHVLAASEAEVDPTLAEVHDARRDLQKRLRGRMGKHDRALLRSVANERRTLRRHEGLDLLEPGTLERPVRGRVIGGFGDYRDPQLDVPMRRNGVELEAEPNDRVVALAPGRVAFVGALPGFERVVVIDHGGGYLSLTARLLSVVVEEDQELEAGHLLGRVGPKAIDDGLGTSVYVELRHGPRPIDPAPFLEKARKRRSSRGSER